jgi:glycosyltransferase involved in cell wall biosynthesis
MPKNRIVKGYDVVDNDHFYNGATKAQALENEYRRQLSLPENFFLAASRFVEKKNLFRLIDAYASYLNSPASPGWHLVLLGDGILRPEVEKKIEELGLGNKILLPGHKDYEILPSYYGLAGAFILASTSEQWGLVVNEAMAAGLPVLVSEKCGCAPDLVVHGQNGFVFDPFDVQALAGYMTRISDVGTDRHAMGRISRDFIQNWTPETFAVNLKKAVRLAVEAPSVRMTLLDKGLLRALGPK